MITNSRKISEHFHSSEFKCPHCGVIKIDENLVNKLEHLFAKLNASKCIISSGYRCPTHDKAIGGFVGRHAEGLAADCIYYDNNGKAIPSKIVCCVANDLGELNGIARINDNYTHLDNRTNSIYRGDEPRGNSSYWTNPYSYFGVNTEMVRVYTGEANSNEKWVNLPKEDETWRVYKTNVSPIKANTHGFIKPAKFGGLSYRVLANPMKDVYTIKTDSFGTVNIYAAASTGATITNTRKYSSGN